MVISRGRLPLPHTQQVILPEWSKGVHSSCIVFALVGSSPTDDIYCTSGLVVKFPVANGEPRVRFPAGAFLPDFPPHCSEGAPRSY